MKTQDVAAQVGCTQLKGKGQQLKGAFSHSSYREMLKMVNVGSSHNNESVTVISNTSDDKGSNSQRATKHIAHVKSRLGSCGGGSIQDYNHNHNYVDTLPIEVAIITASVKQLPQVKNSSIVDNHHQEKRQST